MDADTANWPLILEWMRRNPLPKGALIGGMSASDTKKLVEGLCRIAKSKEAKDVRQKKKEQAQRLQEQKAAVAAFKRKAKATIAAARERERIAQKAERAERLQAQAVERECQRKVREAEKADRLRKRVAAAAERAKKAKEREQKQDERLRQRQAMRDLRENIKRMEAMAEAANGSLRDVADAILMSFGYHQHNRGEWRLSCTSHVLIQFRDEVRKMARQNHSPSEDATPKPAAAVPGEAPAVPDEAPEPPRSAEAGQYEQEESPKPDDLTPEEAEVFAAARAGEEKAQERIRLMLLDQKKQDRVGDIDQELTRRLIVAATAADPMRQSFLEEKAAALWVEILGDKPSVLDKLLARRVINNFIWLQWVEEQLATIDPSDLDIRTDLDKAVSRAQRRYEESIISLTRVRRLLAPKVLAPPHARMLRDPPLIPFHPEESGGTS